MKITCYKKEKKYTVVSLLTCICRGIISLFICGTLGLIIGLAVKKTGTKTYYAYQYVVESTLVVEKPSSAAYIKLLTSNKGISYLNEQINGSWECKDNPVISDNKLFKSLSFVDLSIEENDVARFSISYRNGNKTVAFTSGKVIANASCTYLDQLYLNDTFKVAKYPEEADSRIVVEKPSHTLLLGTVLGLFVGFCLSIYFDLFSDKYFGNGDICTSDFKSVYISEKRFKNFIDSCNGKKIYVLSEFEKNYLTNYFSIKSLTLNVVSGDCVGDGILLLLPGISSFEKINSIKIDDEKTTVYSLLLKKLCIYFVPFYKANI